MVRQLLEELTFRQKEVLEFISATIQQKGYPPTLREIGKRFRIASTNAVNGILEALERKGYIKRRPFLSRGIEITSILKPDFRLVPVVGRIAAGLPILAVENIETHLAVDKSFLPGGEIFSLKVVGDSMKDAGIFDGDYALARRQSIAEPGDIVVAVIGEEATVKKYFPTKKYIRLEPANEEYEPIIVEKGTPDFYIAGKVIGLMRRM